MKRMNVQNDVESRRRIAEALPKEVVKKEVEDGQSEEVPEYPVIETSQKPEAPAKGRRKAAGNVKEVSF